MNDEQYHLLLSELAQITDEAELRAFVERNLTKLDYDFSSWLMDQVDEVSEVDPDKSSRLAAIRRLVIDQLAKTGDYRKAEFDEANPANPREILLALARQIERRELDLAVAVDQGVRALSAYPWRDMPWDWLELAESIVKSTCDQAAHVILAELMYQIEQQLPELLPSYARQAVTVARSAEAIKLLERQEYGAALQVYERLVTVGEESRDAYIRIIGLRGMGNVYQFHLGASVHSDHLIHAEQYYTQALQACYHIGFDLGSSLRTDILLGLGQVIIRQGRFEEGIEYLKKSLALRRSPELVEAQGIYCCLTALAQACQDAADYNAAEAYLREAIATAPDVEARVECLVRLARVLSYLDESDTSEVLAEACRLADSAADQASMHGLRSKVYGLLGVHRAHSGNWEGAMDAYQVAIQSARAGSDEGTEARWLSNLGQVYMLLGQGGDADLVFKQAAKVHQRLNDNLGAANLFMNYGHLLFRAGNLTMAAGFWAAAYSLFHQEQQLTDMGMVALALSRVHRERGDLQRAEACIRYCLSKAEALGTLRCKCLALSELASLQAKQNRVVEAVATYTESIDLAQQIGSLAAEYRPRVMRGELLERQPATLGGAEADYRRSVDLLEKIREPFRALERRVQIQSSFVEAYARLICLLQEQRCRPGAVCEAFTFTERARSRTLVELLSRTRVRQPCSLPPKLAACEEKLLAQLLRLEESEEVGLEPAQNYAQLNQELEDVWREMIDIDEECRDYVDLRRTPVVDFRGILELVGD